MIDKNNIDSFSASKLIRLLNHSTHKYFHHMFSEYSIGHSQVMTLHFIFLHNGISQSELTQNICLDKASITSQLNILEKNKYIRREASKEDARVKNIFLTDKAKSIQLSLEKVFSSWSEIILQGFEEEERFQLLEYLKSMVNNASAKIEEIHGNETNK